MKPNTISRVYHPWWDWECYKAGFYKTTCEVNDAKAKEMYRDFLRDLGAFSKGMNRVTTEWPNSCEQFLTNPSLNRIAWLGQSAMCISTGIPSCYRAGFKLLTAAEQASANGLAQEHLTWWEGTRRENYQVG